LADEVKREGRGGGEGAAMPLREMGGKEGREGRLKGLVKGEWGREGEWRWGAWGAWGRWGEGRWEGMWGE
jgi:hypothetical protein